MHMLGLAILVAFLIRDAINPLFGIFMVGFFGECGVSNRRISMPHLATTEREGDLNPTQKCLELNKEVWTLLCFYIGFLA